MSTTKINVNGVRGLSSTASNAKGKVSSAKSSFARTKNSVDGKIQNRANIRSRMDSLSTRMNEVEYKIGRIDATVQGCANKYSTTELKVNQLGDNVKNNISKKNASKSSAYWASFFDGNDKNIKNKKAKAPEEINSKNVKYKGEFKVKQGYFSKEKTIEIANLRGRLIKYSAECGRFDIDLLKFYFNKDNLLTSDVEKAAILHTFSDIKDVVAILEALAQKRRETISATLLRNVEWLVDFTKHSSFSAVYLEYYNVYLGLLNSITEISKDKKTVAASLIELGIPVGVLSLIGAETEKNLKDVFGSSTFKAYLAKFKTEHSETFIGKLEAEAKASAGASGDFAKLFKKIGDKKDAIEDKLKEKDLLEEEKETKYFDKDGNEIDEKDAPKFYKELATIAEVKAEVSARASLFDYSNDDFLGGEINAVVGEAEAHASIAGGMYVYGKNGEKLFSPGVKAEVGVSVTGAKVDYSNQLLGDENLGLNVDAEVKVLSAEAKADGTIQFLGEGGKFDPQVSVGASAEAVLAEAEGSVGVNVLGGEVEVNGSVKFGIGAHADVGFKDGVVKCEVGASLGLGFDVGFEVDVGGMVNTVADGAKSAWEGISNGWNKLWGK